MRARAVAFSDDEIGARSFTPDLLDQIGSLQCHLCDSHVCEFTRKKSKFTTQSISKSFFITFHIICYCLSSLFLFLCVREAMYMRHATCTSTMLWPRCLDSVHRTAAIIIIRRTFISFISYSHLTMIRLVNHQCSFICLSNALNT